MRQALQLAQKGLGRTWPNPMVGAVLVKKGRIIAQGWHHEVGGPHAEVLALQQAGRQAQGATLFLNLEPCSHYGRTPPCTEAIRNAGVERVVASMQDPNPKVCGRGFARLRQAGIQVEVGLLAAAARQLNEVFIKKITTGLPFIICKAALSLDGKIATENGSSRWISSLAARQYGHRLRSLADVIVVGAGTVIRDDPHLTVRLVVNQRQHQPRRIILAGKRRLPAHAYLIKNSSHSRVIVATTRSHQIMTNSNIEVWHLPGVKDRVDIGALVGRLGKQGMNLVLVEGGAEVHAAFLGLNSRPQRLWADQIQFIIAPKLIGGRQALGPIGGKGACHPQTALGLREMSWEPLGPDMLVKAKPISAPSS